MVKKTASFGKEDYKTITRNYKAESFEEIMSSRFSGKNFDVLLQEKEGKTKGMIILVNDSSNLYVLDIVGRIALDKATKLFTEINKNSAIGEKIKSFTADK